MSKLLTFLSGASLLLLASISFAQSPENNPESEEKTLPNFLIDLKTQFNADELKQFTFENQVHHFFFFEGDLPVQSGTLLIVQEEQEFKKMSHLTFSLAEKMAEKGWNSVIAAIPSPSMEKSENNEKVEAETAEQAISENTAEEATDGADADDFTDEKLERSLASTSSAKLYISSFDEERAELCSRKTSTYIETLSQTIGKQAGRIVLVSSGISSFCILNSGQTFSDSLVLISPFAPNDENNQQIPNLIANTEIPLLDITNDFESRWAYQTRNKRLRAARKNLKKHYRQRQLIGHQLSSIQADYLSKEIYGWLNYLGF